MSQVFITNIEMEGAYGRVKNVKIIYDLTFYSEKKYMEDFDDFVAYQKGNEEFEKMGTGIFKNLGGKEKMKSESSDWKFYRAKEYKLVPYLEFLEKVNILFTEIVQKILADDPGIIFTDDEEFRVTFFLYRVADREWYFNTGMKEGLAPKECAQIIKERSYSSPVEHIDFVIAGVFLIHTIVFPAMNALKIPERYVYRYLVHEFEGHKQIMRGTYEYLEETRSRVKKRRFKRSSNYRANYLFAAVSNLFDVGLMDYATVGKTPRVNIRMNAILDFRKDLQTLTTIEGITEAKEFYEANFDFGTMEKGSFYCGKIMCFTIQLAIAKRKGFPLVAFYKGKALPPLNIDYFMEKYIFFDIGNPSLENFKEAYYTITDLKHYRGFLQLYELACKELGIREEHMVITYARYDELKKKAMNFHMVLAAREKERLKAEIGKIAG